MCAAPCTPSVSMLASLRSSSAEPNSIIHPHVPASCRPFTTSSSSTSPPSLPLRPLIFAALAALPRLIRPQVESITISFWEGIFPYNPDHCQIKMGIGPHSSTHHLLSSPSQLLHVPAILTRKHRAGCVSLPHNPGCKESNKIDHNIQYARTDNRRRSSFCTDLKKNHAGKLPGKGKFGMQTVQDGVDGATGKSKKKNVADRHGITVGMEAGMLKSLREAAAGHIGASHPAGHKGRTLKCETTYEDVQTPSSKSDSEKIRKEDSSTHNLILDCRGSHDPSTLWSGPQEQDASQFEQDAMDKKLSFVKFYLALWGYPPHSPFFGLISTTQQSRHLLLGLAWLLSHCDVFHRALTQRKERLLHLRSNTPLPPYPVDVSSTSEAMEVGREAEANARAHVERLVHSLDHIRDVNERVAGRTQQTLMLYGKVQLALRSIQSLRQCKAKLIHKLSEAQIIRKMTHPTEGRPYSQYELHLLQGKDNELKRHREAFQAEQLVKKMREESGKLEATFWDWMESVVNASLADESRSGTAHNEMTDFSGVSRNDLMPVIQYFQKQLSREKAENDDHEANANRHPRDEVCTQDSLDGVELLPEDIDIAMKNLSCRHSETPPAIQEVCTSSMSEQIVSHLSREPIYVKDLIPANGPNEERTSDLQTMAPAAASEMQRLKTLAVTLSKVLAKTRASNRAKLYQDLEPIMKDESFLLLGL